MENVVAMQDLTKNKRNHLNRIVKELLGIDYQVRLCVLRASNYGDAQHRDRFFLIASKIGVPLPDFPPATHATEYEWVSVQEAIGDLADISPHAGVIELADGTLVTDHVEFGVLPDGGTHNKSQVLKLNSDTPAGTVRRSNVIQHYSHNRVLTIRERARLQSFPSSFRFAGTPSQQAAQIGNAVPIYLARAVARAIREACFSFDATASTTSMR
jgi:DNA (cytosine-5)-methyltransferase 1